MLKIVASIINTSLNDFAEGFFTLCRAIVEIVSSPLSLIIKPLTRGIATLIHGRFKQIEENSGIQTIAEQGVDYLQGVEDSELVSNHQKIYELLAICNDVHRKFDKSLTRGQASEVALDEYSRYSEIRSGTELNREKLIRYFSLFAHKKDKQMEPIQPVICFQNN